MAETLLIQNASELLEGLRYDAEVLVSRLEDGEDAATSIVYARSVARQLDELADLLANEN